MTSDFLTRLPKAELHLHLEGSVDPLTLSQLSEKHHTPFPWTSNRYKPLPNSHRPLSVAEAAALYEYTDFTGFLMAFKAVTERLRDPEDFELITYRLIEKLAAQGCLHAEVFVSVGVIFWRGQEFDRALRGAGARTGARGKRFRRQPLLDLRRRAPLRDRRGGKGCCHGHSPCGNAIPKAAASSASALEATNAWPPRSPSRRCMRRPRAPGFASVSMPGKRWGRLRSVARWTSLGAERVGHALCAADDPELLARLVGQQVPLELCLTSNLRTRCCAELAAASAAALL